MSHVDCNCQSLESVNRHGSIVCVVCGTSDEHCSCAVEIDAELVRLEIGPDAQGLECTVYEAGAEGTNLVRFWDGHGDPVYLLPRQIPEYLEAAEDARDFDRQPCECCDGLLQDNGYELIDDAWQQGYPVTEIVCDRCWSGEGGK